MSSGSRRARLGETLARMDVRPRIQHRQIAGVVVVDRDLEKRLLARRHLAAPVGRERPEQPRHQVRAPRRHDVVDRHRAGQRRQPARFRGLQAQQPDDVARIGVEMLPLGGLVGAHVRVRCREAQIAHMAQQMPLRVLRAGVAEIRADAPIGGGAVGDRPALDRQAADQHEAAPVQDFLAQPVEHRAECRQREIGAADLGDVEAALAHRRRRRSRSRRSRRRRGSRSIRPRAPRSSRPIQADGPSMSGRGGAIVVI